MNYICKEVVVVYYKTLESLSIGTEVIYNKLSPEFEKGITLLATVGEPRFERKETLAEFL